MISICQEEGKGGLVESENGDRVHWHAEVMRLQEGSGFILSCCFLRQDTKETASRFQMESALPVNLKTCPSSTSPGFLSLQLSQSSHKMEFISNTNICNQKRLFNVLCVQKSISNLFPWRKISKYKQVSCHNHVQKVFHYLKLLFPILMISSQHFF